MYKQEKQYDIRRTRLDRIVLLHLHCYLLFALDVVLINTVRYVLIRLFNLQLSALSDYSMSVRDLFAL